jgi:choline-sulfatase
MADLPNILLIMSDQHRADAMGCAGHELVHSPNLDALAARGVRFAHTTVQAPICGAARASFATGKYVRDHGCFDNNQDLPPGSPTLMHSLRTAGYWTSCIGKMHLSSDETRAAVSEPMLNGDLADQMRALGFDEPYPGPDKVAITGMPSEYRDYLEKEGLLDRFSEWFEPYRYQRMAAGNNRSAPMWRTEPSPLPAEAHIDSWIGRRVARWIEQYDRPQPFFLWVGISGPHDPWDPPEQYIDRYRDAEISLGSLVPPSVPESGPTGTRSRQRSSPRCGGTTTPISRSSTSRLGGWSKPWSSRVSLTTPGSSTRPTTVRCSATT